MSKMATTCSASVRTFPNWSRSSTRTTPAFFNLPILLGNFCCGRLFCRVSTLGSAAARFAYRLDGAFRASLALPNSMLNGGVSWAWNVRLASVLFKRASWSPSSRALLPSKPCCHFAFPYGLRLTSHTSSTIFVIRQALRAQHSGSATLRCCWK